MKMKDIIYIILTLATATSIVTENRSQVEGTYLEFYFQNQFLIRRVVDIAVKKLNESGQTQNYV